MSGIEVDIVASAPIGSLVPRYNEESAILEVGTDIEADWPLGIDVDGSMVFDFTAERVLANFDLLIPNKNWRHGEVADSREYVPRFGCLRVSERSLEIKSFSLPLRVLTDRTGHVVQVLIGESTPVEHVWLSSRCLALLAGRELCGFLMMVE